MMIVKMMMMIRWPPASRCLNTCQSSNPLAIIIFINTFDDDDHHHNLIITFAIIIKMMMMMMNLVHCHLDPTNNTSVTRPGRESLSITLFVIIIIAFVFLIIIMIIMIIITCSACLGCLEQCLPDEFSPLSWKYSWDIIVNRKYSLVIIFSWNYAVDL